MTVNISKPEQNLREELVALRAKVAAGVAQEAFWFSGDGATTEKAPSTRLSASFIRSGMSRWSDRAIRWMMHSLSDEDWKIEPRSISSRRKALALVMLPLCAIAAPPMENSPKNGCTSRIAAPLDPAVE